MNLIINARESKNVTVLELKGKLTMGAVDALNEKVKSLIDSVAGFEIAPDDKIECRRS